MSTQEIGWKFPPTGGGEEHGWNDSGIALFRGATLASFARELLQNSIDARVAEPVQVSFELVTTQRQPDDGWQELAAAIDSCRREESADDKAKEELARAAQALESDEMTFLRVADRNTTGLHGRHWHSLVKQRGVNTPEQREEAGGGSHGQGKSAAFLFSPLRTILYWSRFDGPDGPVERFQGKAILMTHRGNGSVGPTQGVGYFGIREECSALEGFDIPGFVRPKEYGGNRGNGTSLYIAGFHDYPGWQRDIAASVIANFFHAIDNGQLAVTIEPDSDMIDREIIEIAADTLNEWYDYLRPDDDDGETPDDSLARSAIYRDIVANDAAVECDDKDLGHCSLWIRVADDLPRTVALIRRTGMLITDSQDTPGIKQFYGLRPFAAVCRFDSEKGNKLLRGMENPRHDQFEPEWLPESDRDRGEKALKRIAGWIRDEIKKVAAHQPTGEATPITELAELLPDIESDEPLVGRPADKKSSGKRRKIVVKRPKPTPPNPNPRPSDSIPIRDVRQLPHSDDAKKLRIGFTPQVTALVRLRLEEAGDSEAFQRSDLRLYEVDTDAEVDVDHLAVKADERVELDVVADASVHHRAWRVSAVKVAES